MTTTTKTAKRFHEDRCSSHPTTTGAIGDVTWCDGSCMTEV